MVAARILVGALLLAAMPGWAAAQQVADYDAALAPYPAATRQFCEAAPECARMRPVLDANGNSVKRN